RMCCHAPRVRPTGTAVWLPPPRRDATRQDMPRQARCRGEWQESSERRHQLQSRTCPESISQRTLIALEYESTGGHLHTATPAADNVTSPVPQCPNIAGLAAM